MTFSDEKGRAGKRYVVMVDVILDRCQLEYGVAPCQAVLGTDSQHKCQNTFSSCADTDNYDPADKTYRFIQPLAGLPRTVDAYPLLDLDNPVEFAPTRLDPGNSLGKRASVTVRFKDAPHHDRGIDKYARERITGEAAADGSTYDPYEQGTFFGKLRARNPFYLGRKLHVYSGYIPWDHDQPPDRQIQLDQTVTTAQDSTTNANDGTLVNGPTWVSDGPNENIRGALSFDGTDEEHVSIPDDGSLSPTSAITVMCWFYPDSALYDKGRPWGSTLRTMMSKGNLSGVPYAFGWNPGSDAESPDGEFLARITTDGSGQHTVATDSITLDAWNHGTITYDGANLISYINGLEAAREAATGDISQNSARDLLIADSGSTRFFPGKINDPRVYNFAMTEQQIQDNMNTRLNGDEAGLVGYWPLTDGLTGFTEQDLLDHLQKRTYVMERWEGPDTNGSFRIVAKDILKLADDDRAQAPLPSGGRLDSSITAGDGSATLTPAGIGDEEYPASGRAKLSDEIVAFTRSGDSLTLTTRGDLNTEAESHDQGDTVQLIYEQEGSKASAIVEDLLLNYANIDSAFIDPDSPSVWEAEDDTYIGRLFTGYVVEPTPVVDLINELSRQAGFFIWWDDLNQLIQFKAIRQPDTVTISLTDEDAFIEGTIRQKEQPDKRRSQIWVYHGHIRPTDDLDKGKHYATVFVLTESAKEAANAYGRKAIQKIFSRWISQTNRPAAEDLAGRIMSRFQDPPRRLEFTLPGSRSEVETGDIFNATTRLIQNERGENDTRRMIALSKEDTGEGTYRIDAEEFLFVEQDDEGVKRVVVTADINDFKARDEFDLIYASVESGDEVQFEINEGVLVGASDPSGPAWDMQDWPSGVTFTVINNGRIEGAAGDGGDSSVDGEDGGVAFKTAVSITLENNNEIWGGGGGGGGALIQDGGLADAGGGGGGGQLPGSGGAAVSGGGAAGGDPGTTEVGGSGGFHENLVAGYTATGGDGGDPGQSGQSGQTTGSGSSTNGSGGSAGAAIDGDSFVTYDTTGDIRGAQIN